MQRTLHTSTGTVGKSTISQIKIKKNKEVIN
jgi:hypothetical protein